MNRIEDHYCDSRSEFRGFDRNPGDAEYLVEKLQDLARRQDEEWKAKLLPRTDSNTPTV
jgi:hypothetical protein